MDVRSIVTLPPIPIIRPIPISSVPICFPPSIALTRSPQTLALRWDRPSPRIRLEKSTTKTLIDSDRISLPPEEPPAKATLSSMTSSVMELLETTRLIAHAAHTAIVTCLGTYVPTTCRTVLLTSVPPARIFSFTAAQDKPSRRTSAR